MSTQEIWFEFKSGLYNFILSRVKDPSLSEDLLQEVFIKIHKKKVTLKDESKIRSWVYSITRNTVMDHFRKTQKGPEIDKKIEQISDIEEEREFHSCLGSMLHYLEPKYREALELTDLGTMTQKEFAHAKGLSLSGAKSRVQRAKAKLKELYIYCCNPKFDTYGNLISREEGCKLC